MTKITFSSFGFKYGAPREANYVFDLRFIPNPYYVAKLRPLSGRDAEVQKYILDHEEGRSMLARCVEFLDFVIPAAEKAKRENLHIALGCTGGRHRSVAFAEWLFARYKDNHSVSVFHRDISRDGGGEDA